MSIQENGLIDNSLWMKYARGVLKSNEIPNAYFMVDEDLLIICLHSTVLYVIHLPQSAGIVSKVFTAYIDENKEMIPVEMDVNNKYSYGYYQNLAYQFENHYKTFCTVPNITCDVSFQKLMELKAADGMKFYKVHGMIQNNIHTWFVPVFSGFPSLNKQDSADIIIKKDTNYSKYFIVNYHIFKAKIKKYIDVYFTAIELY